MEPQKNPEWPKQSYDKQQTTVGGITLSDFRLFYKATVIKTVFYWHKKRHVNQWNRIQRSERNPHTYGHLIYEKGGKVAQWRKGRHLNNWHWENWTDTRKRMKLEHSLILCKKINWRHIEHWDGIPDTIKALEENISSTLFDKCSVRYFWCLKNIYSEIFLIHLLEQWK